MEMMGQRGRNFASRKAVLDLHRQHRDMVAMIGATTGLGLSTVREAHSTTTCIAGTPALPQYQVSWPTGTLLCTPSKHKGAQRYATVHSMVHRQACTHKSIACTFLHPCTCTLVHATHTPTHTRTHTCQ